jgi:Bacterial Ig domain
LRVTLVGRPLAPRCLISPERLPFNFFLKEKSMFPRRLNFPRQGLRALTKLLLTLAFVFAVQHAARAAGTFVSAPSRVDMVYDSARDTLYITSGGSVLRYRLSTNSFLAPFNLGGSLAGLDISPDGNTLVVADRTRDASNVWVHVVDLRTGAASRALFPRAFGEGGTFTVAYGSDNRVIISGTYEGSGWVPLRQLDPATGTWRDLKPQFPDLFGQVRQDTMLAASGDRSVVGFAESNASDGPVGRFRVSDSNIIQRTGYTNGTSWFNYEIGVNKNGTQYAVPTYGGTFIYNTSVLKTGTVLGTYAGPQPVGVVYHPVEDIVYFPWTTTQEVRAFDTNTFAQVAAYNFEDTFKSNGNWAFQQGRMKMSRDGSLLFATVTGGVRFIRLYAPLAASDQSVTTVENTPAAVTLAGSVGNGGALSYKVATQPAHGTLSGTGANLTYTPETNYEGSDSFTFRSVYGPAESAPATVSITVTHGNDAPTADDQSVAVDEDGSAVITLTGTDPDGSPVTFTVTTQPAYGTLGGTAPNLVYTPAENFYGSDSFAFQTSDGAASSVGHVYITVNGVNDPPAVNSQSLATDEDSYILVTLTGTDIDSSPLSYTVSSPPAHGKLNGTAPNLVYVPATDYNGPDSFGFKASDGSANSNDATVTINVRPVNDAPVATPQSAATDEDTPVSVTLSGTDADGDALSYTVVDAPGHGTLSGTAPNLVYTPAANYNGPDNFTFRASDGTAESGWRYVSISVASVNDVPKSRSDALSTIEDSAFTFTFYGSDADYDPLTFTIVSQPAHGTLSGTGQSRTYTPDPDYNGTDSFSYKISDGAAESSVATMSVSIMAVNDAPVANAQTVSATEDASVPVTLTADDLEGDQLGYGIMDYPQHGVLSGTIPNLAYKVNPNYNGPDSFSFRAYDGKAWSATVTVTINVSAVNDAPAANPQSVALGEDASGTVVLSGSDVDGDAVSYAVVGAPAHGSLSGTAPNLVYTPAPNYNGPDSFTFRVSDGSLSSAPATVSLSVNAVNDAPTANGQAVATNEDASKPFTLTGSDVDGDALTYMLVTVPQHGSLSGTVPNLVYTPAANYNGPDGFTFVVYDGRAQSASATVTISVASVNDAPVAVGDAASVAKNSSAVNIAVLSNDGDADGDALTVTSVTQPPNGTVSVAAGGKSVSYTPRRNYRGNDVFYYTVGDGRGGTATAAVTVTVK